MPWCPPLSSHDKTVKAPSQQRLVAPLLLLGVAATFTRFYRLGYQSFWFDEVFSLRVAEKPIRALIAKALYDAVHPPSYYLLLHPLLKLSAAFPGIPTECWARLPSAVFGVIFVLLMFITADALLGRRVAWITAVITLLSPYQVFYSQETRMYAMLEVLTLLSTLLLYRAAGTGKATMWVGYVVATVLSLMTNYMALGLVAAHGVWALLEYRRTPRTFGRWALSQVGVLLLCLPWIIGMLRLGHHLGDRAEGGSVMKAVNSLVAMFLDFNFGYFQGLFRENVGVLVMTVFVGSLIALCFWWPGARSLAGRSVLGTKDGDRPMAGSLILLSFLGPAAFSFLAAILTEFHLSRYYAVSYPAAAMILAVGIDSAKQRRNPIAGVGSALLLAIWLLCLKNVYSNPIYAREDWRAVSRFFSETKQPQDLLVFNASWEDQAFREYYKQSFNMAGLPSSVGPKPEEVARDSERTVAGHGRVWLVLCYNYITDPRGYVRKWFDKNLQRLETHRFSQIEVLLYRNPHVDAPHH